MLNKKLEKINEHIDRIALNKRLSIEAEHLKRIKCIKTLRLFVNPDRDSIRIYTRVIGDTVNNESVELWDLVRRVVVGFNTKFTSLYDLDESCDSPANIQENEDFGFEEINSIFEWTKDSKSEAFIAYKPENVKNAQILVKFTNKRQLLKLNQKLRKILNKYSDTKPNIIKDFYRYVNNNKLNDYTTATVKCDQNLLELFGVESFNFNDISEMIDPFTEPLGYCAVNIDLNEPQIWDISMEYDDLSQMPHLYPKNVLEIEKKIEATRACSKKITDKINELEDFINDPVFFVNRKIALESDGIGVQTAFYENLDVQTAVFELLKKNYK